MRHETSQLLRTLLVGLSGTAALIGTGIYGVLALAWTGVDDDKANHYMVACLACFAATLVCRWAMNEIDKDDDR